MGFEREEVNPVGRERREVVRAAAGPGRVLPASSALKWLPIYKLYLPAAKPIHLAFASLYSVLTSG